MPIWDHQISFDVEFHLMCSSFFVLTFCHIQLEVSCHPWKCRKWIPSQTLDETSSWFMDYSACKSSRVPWNWLKKWNPYENQALFPEKKTKSTLWSSLVHFPGCFAGYGPNVKRHLTWVRLWELHGGRPWSAVDYVAGAHHLSPRLLDFRRDMIWFKNTSIAIKHQKLIISLFFLVCFFYQKILIGCFFFKLEGFLSAKFLPKKFWGLWVLSLDLFVQPWHIGPSFHCRSQTSLAGGKEKTVDG